MEVIYLERKAKSKQHQQRAVVATMKSVLNPPEATVSSSIMKRVAGRRKLFLNIDRGTNLLQ